MNRAGFFVAIGIVAYFLIVVFTLPAVQVEGYIQAEAVAERDGESPGRSSTSAA